MRKTNHQQNQFLYLRIAGNIEQQVVSEVLRIGDKLPSLRTICREHGVSQSTVLQAYHHLESRALIESRPQSGYFVRHSPRQFPAIPSTSNPGKSTGKNDAEELVAKVYDNLGDNSYTALSLGVPSNELLPIAKLNKGLVHAIRELKGSGIAYEQVQGNKQLRRQIARWSLAMDAGLSEGDIIITDGCINAISYCMMTLTQRGDAIAVESPISFGILQLAQNLGLKVIELPTHPQTGIELSALKEAFAKKRSSYAC
ncbi:MAG: GntR family transcriptional regulator [Bacteroidota bacterium]